MKKRFASLWFRHLKTDWMTVCRPRLAEIPFVLAISTHGKIVVSASSPLAEQEGVFPGMGIADAKAILPDLKVIHERVGLEQKLLHAIAHWCIRYTPVAALDLPDGIVMDISGCAHLWGGEKAYLEHIISRLKQHGYDVRMSIADSIGGAWAVARYGQGDPIVVPKTLSEVLKTMPAQALRLEPTVLQRLQALGLKTIGSFSNMPRVALRRRFGHHLLLRLDQAMGNTDEFIMPIKPIVPYEERLPCLEPIQTAKGIELAVQELLVRICTRLLSEGKGLREAVLLCHRMDGKIEQVAIGTNRATAQVQHLFQLFALKISQIEPGLGIELFVLEVPKVEEAPSVQENLWSDRIGLDHPALTELLDRLKNRDPSCDISRYLPAARYWPERSMQAACSLQERSTVDWQQGRPRPTRLLHTPEPIVVTAPIPDYPPMLFRYNGRVHTIKKADGPERIEREWWIDKGEHRDYYAVEDEEGQRFWLYRSGHYDESLPKQWFLHGFFA
ncbi:DNA polymerase Y family protein [Sphingobacterium thalpophilum]|uniref:Y-family DNA polymerase n=1 Tax=Sphingobacterium thalpophilum TaxID=259 RepID=UPI0037D9AC98